MTRLEILRDINAIKKEIDDRVSILSNGQYIDHHNNVSAIDENSNSVLDTAEIIDENSTSITDLAEMIADLEARVAALEEK